MTRKSLLASVTLLALSTLSASAHAAFMGTLTWTNGGSGSFIIADNGPNDLNGAADVVQFSHSQTGSYSFGGTFLLQPTGNGYQLVLQNFTAQNLSGTTTLVDVTLQLEATLLTTTPGLPGSNLASNLSVQQGIFGQNTTLTSVITSPAVLPVVATVSGTGSSSATSPNFISAASFDLEATYYIPQLLPGAINLGGGNFLGQSVTVVNSSSVASFGTPEPASLAAWGGMGLFGLVMAARRRRQK